MADRDREEVRREIEGTKASMGAKLEELSGRVESARERMSLRRQVDEHPWTAMGVSMAVGFVLQRLLRGRRCRQVADASAGMELGPARPRRGFVDTVSRAAMAGLARTLALSMVSTLARRIAHRGEGGGEPAPPVAPPPRGTTQPDYPPAVGAALGRGTPG